MGDGECVQVSGRWVKMGQESGRQVSRQQGSRAGEWRTQGAGQVGVHREAGVIFFTA